MFGEALAFHPKVTLCVPEEEQANPANRAQLQRRQPRFDLLDCVKKPLKACLGWSSRPERILLRRIFVNPLIRRSQLKTPPARPTICSQITPIRNSTSCRFRSQLGQSLRDCRENPWFQIGSVCLLLSCHFKSALLRRWFQRSLLRSCFVTALGADGPKFSNQPFRQRFHQANG
jgi:hypothetical protein